MTQINNNQTDKQLIESNKTIRNLKQKERVIEEKNDRYLFFRYLS